VELGTARVEGCWGEWRAPCRLAEAAQVLLWFYM